MFHPVFDINKERYIPLKRTDFNLNFSKKSLYELSKPKNSEYIKEGYLYIILDFNRILL